MSVISLMKLILFFPLHLPCPCGMSQRVGQICLTLCESGRRAGGHSGKAGSLVAESESERASSAFWRMTPLSFLQMMNSCLLGCSFCQFWCSRVDTFTLTRKLCDLSGPWPIGSRPGPAQHSTRARRGEARQARQHKRSRGEQRKREGRRRREEEEGEEDEEIE